MTKHDYKQNSYYMLYLISCYLNDKKPSKEKLKKIDLSQLYTVSMAHSLTAITAYALESAMIIDKRFTEGKAKSIRKSIAFDYEREKILAEFEKNGVWYLPLKGIVLKDYYPMIGMREMCDNDILFDYRHTSEVKSIMDNLGFVIHRDNNGHDIMFTKKPIYNFEMHVAFFNNGIDAAIDSYYNKNILKKENKKYCCKLTNEDLYIYITAHEYEHYSMGGTGLRNLIDRYVYLNHFDNILDMSYIEQELFKMNIDNFEKKSREMIIKIFNGTRLNNEELKMLDYYIFSGTYGTIENAVNNKVKKLGGNKTARIKYALDRFLIPINKCNPKYKNYRAEYPLFYKYKVLIPILPFYRLFSNLFKRRILTEFKTLLNL